MLEKETNSSTIDLPQQTLLALGPSLDSDIVLLKKSITALVIDKTKYPGYWAVKIFDEKSNNFGPNIYFLPVPPSNP